MRPIEADYIRERLLAQGPEAASPVANIGSSTAWFRTVRKPHIETRLFKPLREAGFDIVHIDIKAEEGVDLVADLTDLDVVRQLHGRGFKSAICSNLLEHIGKPAAFADACQSIVPDGLLIVTVPHSYPYHPDPIDTLFRPSPDELVAMFPRSKAIDTTILNDGTGWTDQMSAGPRALALLPIKMAWWLVSGLWRPEIARAALSRVSYWNKPISVTCAVLKTGPQPAAA